MLLQLQSLCRSASDCGDPVDAEVLDIGSDAAPLNYIFVGDHEVSYLRPYQPRYAWTCGILRLSGRNVLHYGRDSWPWRFPEHQRQCCAIDGLHDPARTSRNFMDSWGAGLCVRLLVWKGSVASGVSICLPLGAGFAYNNPHNRSRCAHLHTLFFPLSSTAATRVTQCFPSNRLVFWLLSPQVSALHLLNREFLPSQIGHLIDVGS